MPASGRIASNHPRVYCAFCHRPRPNARGCCLAYSDDRLHHRVEADALVQRLVRRRNRQRRRRVADGQDQRPFRGNRHELVRDDPVAHRRHRRDRDHGRHEERQQAETLPPPSHRDAPAPGRRRPTPPTTTSGPAWPGRRRRRRAIARLRVGDSREAHERVHPEADQRHEQRFGEEDAGPWRELFVHDHDGGDQRRKSRRLVEQQRHGSPERDDRGCRRTAAVRTERRTGRRRRASGRRRGNTDRAAAGKTPMPCPSGAPCVHPQPMERDVARVPFVSEPVVSSRERDRAADGRHRGDQGVGDAERPRQCQRVARIERLPQPAGTRRRCRRPTGSAATHETRVERLARGADRPVGRERRRARPAPDDRVIVERLIVSIDDASRPRTAAHRPAERTRRS